MSRMTPNDFEFGVGHSTIFAIRCSYVGERPQMAPQVPESAQIAYSFHNLKVFEPSRAPLDPSGGKSDHPMGPRAPRRAQKPSKYQGNMRVGRIQGLEGPFWASRLHMSSVLRKGCCGIHQMHVFAIKGAKPSPGGRSSPKPQYFTMILAWVTAPFSQNAAHMQARGPK